ncbi:transposase [Bifidobacterium longum subsp. infantis]|nr:transposase [Bifidobacterium longum]QUF87618.1 transposase [Bifidobacterium longum subsp. infantis]UPT08992.1 transposase [Bifidobacterium longum subsp. infantis]UUY27229.1 transposase [Bifidobacterium longum subsp. infantis]
MCTPGYGITLDRFMRVAHLLPRQSGNVAVDNYRFVNALLWMCRTGAPWRDLPECYGKWITVCRRFNRWSGNGAMERLFTALQEERTIGVEIRVLAMDSTSVKVHQHAAVPPKRNRTDPWDYDRQAHKGRNMVERVFNRMKHHRKAATRYDRLDATFLANLQLILITIQLKNTSKTN